MENNRGQWGSNFGFLMAAVGSAVGLGNIWGFPYKMGMSGGFAFLLVYLILAAMVGVVVMLGELTLGRLTGKGTMGAYLHFSKKYAWVGFMGVFSGFLILSFYSVLGGMVMRYMIGYMLQLLGLDGFATQGTGFFGFMLYDYGGPVVKAPYELLGLTADSPAFAMWNDCWLDLYDMIAEGVLMPLGAMVMSILIGWVWKINVIQDECELNGNKFRAAKYFDICFKFIVPAVMVVVLIAQFGDFFG